MIVFDLCCDAGHRFEGWFASSAEFARQCEGDLVSCPECGSVAVDKAPMAPAVPRKANQLSAPSRSRKDEQVVRGPLPAKVAEALVKLAQAQAKALENSRWVGQAFAEESRAMHYGEREAKPIHGQATADEAKELLDEGIAIAPLPFPVAPPDELN
jgi:hypothetical protein